MVDDPTRKSPRTFQCRDALWDALESFASENEQTVDYLLNEAIRAYLQSHGRSVFTPRVTAAPALPPARPAAPSVPPPMPKPAGAAPPIPKLPSMGGPPPLARPSLPPMAPPSPGPAHGPPPMPKPMGGMPPMPKPAGGPPRMPPMPAREKQLYATFEGQEYLVDKDEFFIGRGQKVCDVVIRDTNVSRQHAKVMKHNGAWWMLDNQSLNGVEFRGAKLQQKRIDDGDVFLVCGHAIQFNFR